MVAWTPVALLLLACVGPEPAPEQDTTAWERDAEQLDEAVLATARWAEAAPRAWTRATAHAEALAARGKHTGRPDDLEAADRVLDEAFDRAPEGAGPWLARARLDHSLHRYDAAVSSARRVLGAVVVPDGKRADALGLLGRIALDRGELEQADLLLSEAHSFDPDPAAWADLAVLAQASGKVLEAEAHWRAAEAACACPGDRFDAWVQLQRGLVHLEADAPERALPFFAEAERRYRGDWVFQEHLAEALAATGQLEAADATYALAVDTTRDPEVLGAWAGVKRELGQDAEADALIAEARAGFTAALDRFPESAAGHAVDFFAEHGPPELALRAARVDARVRPTDDRLARLETLELR